MLSLQAARETGGGAPSAAALKMAATPSSREILAPSPFLQQLNLSRYSGGCLEDGQQRVRNDGLVNTGSSTDSLHARAHGGEIGFDNGLSPSDNLMMREGKGKPSSRTRRHGSSLVRRALFYDE